MKFVFALIILPALAGAAPVFTNAYVRLAFDDAGRLASLRENATGRELIAEPRPFVEARFADGTVGATALRAEGDALVFDIGARGCCRLGVTPFDGGWTFRIREANLSDAEELVFAQIPKPSCAKKKGTLSNVVMDETSAVVIRGYSPEVEMARPGYASERVATDGETLAAVRRENGFIGKAAGLSAGPRAEIRKMLKAMTLVSGATVNRCGGAWALDAEENRAGYLFATWMDMESLDDWLRLMDKAGTRTLHFHAWWKTRGHYEPDCCFPGGYDEMKKAVERVHRLGYRASTHTLSAAVQFGDPWISAEHFDDFIADAEYTLAKSFRRGDAELVVNERPWRHHARILTGGTNGNLLQLGGDLLQYVDFTMEPPYRFTGISLASAPYGEAAVYDNTQAVAASGDVSDSVAKVSGRILSREVYPAGQRVRYLHQRYAEFYPRHGTRLEKLVTDRLAWLYDHCGFDGLYFDGSEGFGTRLAVDRAREETCAKLAAKHPCIVNSASCRNPFNWYFRSMMGTWDHPNYGPKSFHDRHLAVYLDGCEADFLPLDAGWWNTRAASPDGRGYFPEEMEYFGCKCAANDATVSIMGARVTDGPLAFSMDDQLTLAGWWERARYAKALRPEALPRLKVPGAEFRLRQDCSGEWTVRPVPVDRHRVATEDFSSWQVSSDEARPAEIRIEALYAADHVAAATNAIRLVDASMLPVLARNSARGVEMELSREDDARHGAVLRFTAKNFSAPEKGAWARVARVLPRETFIRVNPVSTLWVKGDGSGATLNVQVHQASAFGTACSENLVVLDFTGWRKVDLLLRERDADASAAFDWPYEGKDGLTTAGQVFRTTIGGGATVDSLNFYLNGIPVGSSATVELGAWDSIPQHRGGLGAGASVVLNGETFTVPFALPGGDYAELKDGAWTHYAESGLPLERMSCRSGPRLKKGTNALAYEGHAATGFARAEVTVFGLGVAEPAFVPLTLRQKELLNVEYELPFVLSPARGLVGPFAVKVRPGETAHLGFEILGPIVNPVIAGRRIPVTLADASERVTCEDGRTWRAVKVIPGTNNGENRTRNASRRLLASGTIEALPGLQSGVNEIDVTADAADSARVTLWKSYSEPASADAEEVNPR